MTKAPFPTPLPRSAFPAYADARLYAVQEDWKNKIVAILVHERIAARQKQMMNYTIPQVPSFQYQMPQFQYMMPPAGGQNQS